jgi:hypothetical protein
MNGPMREDYIKLLKKTVEISKSSTPVHGEDYEITVRKSRRRVSYANDHQITLGGKLFND